MGRRLFAIRYQLRVGKPPRRRLPRLHPTRRRPHRPERTAVFAQSIARLRFRSSSEATVLFAAKLAATAGVYLLDEQNSRIMDMRTILLPTSVSIVLISLSI